MRLNAPVALAIAVVIVLAIAGPASAAVEPGVDADITRTEGSGTRVDRVRVDRTLRALADSGTRWVRLPILWTIAEPRAKGSYDQGYLSDVDYAIAGARRLGIDVLLLVEGTPRWASARPAPYDQHFRPARYGDYADFYAYVVRRYAPLGVHAYEVWNEPNSRLFWPSAPARAGIQELVDAPTGAAQYAEMLRATYPAIKRADPAATVITGGLSTNDEEYLNALYRAGGGRYFDAVGAHPYSDREPPDAPCQENPDGKAPRQLFCGLASLRQVMLLPANDDGGKRIWVTELGWANCPNSWPGCFQRGVTLQQQAQYETRAFAQLNSAYPYVKVALWYNLRDVVGGPPYDDPRDWSSNLGLLREDFRPKPAYLSFKRYAATLGRGPSPGVQAVAGAGVWGT